MNIVNEKKCSKCIFYDLYRDMGATVPCCTIEKDLCEAVSRIKKHVENNSVCCYYCTKEHVKLCIEKLMKGNTLYG